MPTNTPKFNLIKPLKSEKYNVDVFNGNADIIDSQIYSKTEVDTALNGKANTTTTINNQPLSSNITINASGVPNTPAGNISATNVQNAMFSSPHSGEWYRIDKQISPLNTAYNQQN